MKKNILVITVLLSLSAGFAQTIRVPAPEVKQPDNLTAKKDEPGGDIGKPAENPDTAIYNSAGLAVQPQYPGGIDLFTDYIAAHFNYKSLSPDYDKTATLKVYVNFIIEKDGSLNNLKILRDPGYGTGKEIERIIKSDKTKWSPGAQNGLTVRASYAMPIKIVPPNKDKHIMQYKN